MSVSVGIRWTIGDVSPCGFEALRLSILGAWAAFGPAAAYTVCVNTIDPAAARRRTGTVPGMVPDVVGDAVTWRPATVTPEFLRPHLDAGMAEGTAWKLAPLRCFPDRHEIALDNDCILWALPDSLRDWLAAGDPHACLMAADVRLCHGQFTPWAGRQPGNTGIRGFPPGFDVGEALRRLLARHPVRLTSELDEQGLQVAAFQQDRPLTFVTTDEVSICSPFWPHQPHLGRFGAHFVGLNARHLPWRYYDRPAVDCLVEHWRRHQPALERLTAPTVG